MSDRRPVDCGVSPPAFHLGFGSSVPGEALGLTWRDLDIENGRAAIVRALVPIDGRLFETEPKTKRGRRLIALDAETVAALQEPAARQLVEQQELSDDWIDSGRVFTTEDGAQLHPERISALFHRLVAAAALPKIPLHGLRHTYASLALAKGVNAAIVSRRLGRATVAFTLDIYSHVLPQVDAEAAELIAAFAIHESQNKATPEITSVPSSQGSLAVPGTPAVVSRRSRSLEARRALPPAPS